MQELNDFLISLTKDKDANNKLFNKYLENNNYTDKCNNNLFHLMLEENCNIKQKLLAIQTFAQNGVNINHKNYFGDNYIQTAMRFNYSIRDIIDLMYVGCIYGFNVNGVNSLKQNLFHTFIRSSRSYAEITTLLFSLINNEDFHFKTKDDVGNSVMVYILNRDDINDVFKKFLIDTIFDEIIKRSKKKQDSDNQDSCNHNVVSIDAYIKKRK